MARQNMHRQKGGSGPQGNQILYQVKLTCKSCIAVSRNSVIDDFRKKCQSKKSQYIKLCKARATRLSVTIYNGRREEVTLLSGSDFLGEEQLGYAEKQAFAPGI